jgi:hypothetical protein
MKMAAAVVIGFLFGALLMFLARPAQRVHAATQLSIHVGEIPKGGEVDMQGSKVVGFSCVPATPDQPVKWRCFVASTD